jgi:hypothetical protein
MLRYRDGVPIQRRRLNDDSLEWHDLPKRGFPAFDQTFNFEKFEYRERPANATKWAVYDAVFDTLMDDWCGSPIEATTRAFNANQSFSKNKDLAPTSQRFRPVKCVISDV